MKLRFSVHGSLHNKVTKVMSYFYQSTFNDDLDSNYIQRMPEEIVREIRDGEERFKAWQRLTQNNVNPCSLSWHKYKPFEEILNDILS